MVDRVSPLTGQRPVVESDGVQSKEFRLWTQVITQRALILGQGSPEGVVEARQGSEYADTDGTTGSIKYFKKFDFIESPPGNPDYTLGWVLI